MRQDKQQNDIFTKIVHKVSEKPADSYESSSLPWSSGAQVHRRYFSVTISTTEISVVMLQPSDDKASFLYKAGRQLGFILEKSQEQVQKQNLPLSSASFSGWKHEQFPTSNPCGEIFRYSLTSLLFSIALMLVKSTFSYVNCLPSFKTEKKPKPNQF